MFTDYRFLIIAGTSKAGTTSVFNYFARHPQICPAEKETRFFLDVNYPLSSSKRFQKHGPDVYLSLFDAGPRDAWRFEATPDYLYSATAARAIHDTLPDVRLIFILREPVSRLLSWYRFGRKRAEIGLDSTFDEYISMQRRNGGGGSDCRHKHPAYCALQHGRYSTYLQEWLELFGRSSLYIGFCEHLERDPCVFVRSICNWAGLEPAYFDDYQFTVMNKGSDVRNRYLHKAYADGKEYFKSLARRSSLVYSASRRVGQVLDPIYQKFNVLSDRKVVMSSETRDFLLDYYKGEAQELVRMFGIEVPWASDGVTTLS